MTKFPCKIFVFAALIGFVSQPMLADDCNIIYRIWQDGENSYFDYGETIVLPKGQKADLYIHLESKGNDPYSTLAEIGAPSNFISSTHQGKDVARVLRLGSHDPRKGKISFETTAVGKTGLGYRITEVVRPGRLDDIPAACRAGQVHITVAEQQTSLVDPPPAASSMNEATQALIANLFQGILRRSESEIGDYPNDWFDRVEREGLRGLIFVAETMASSTEFREAAVSRTRKTLQSTSANLSGISQPVLEGQLLADIMKDLYGGARLDNANQSLLSNNLSNCLAGRGGAVACRRFGRDLVSQRQYFENNRELLQHWQR